MPKFEGKKPYLVRYIRELYRDRRKTVDKSNPGKKQRETKKKKIIKQIKRRRSRKRKRKKEKKRREKLDQGFGKTIKKMCQKMRN